MPAETSVAFEESNLRLMSEEKALQAGSPSDRLNEIMARYRAAISAYIAAATRLDGSSSHPVFEEAFRRAEKARLEFERVRAELHQQIKRAWLLH